MPSLIDIYGFAESCPYHFMSPSHLATDEQVVGVGGDLHTNTLTYAYLHGFFPWFNHGEPITWWSPNPRCVIVPENFMAKKSLKRTARQKNYHMTLNQAFEAVIGACRLPRTYTHETWINPQMQAAYIQLHYLGLAHSLEVWSDVGELVGGLYGIKIGACFFGESMFHTQTDASKLAFWALTKLCQETNVALIDCQLVNEHLLSLGATTMTRKAYLKKLAWLTTPKADSLAKDWQNFTWFIASGQL